MKVVLFTHSLLSDWNHGNAHFLRGVVSDLVVRGHDVDVREPRDAWSLKNLLRDHGHAPVREVRRVYPELHVTRYDPGTPGLDAAVEGADLVLVHEWSDPDVVAELGRLRREADFRLLFHDTHHRAASEPEAMETYDLTGYDGVLVFGEVLREIYLKRGWTRRAWAWHEAADVRRFRPLPDVEPERDLVWIGNWGDEERTDQLREFLLEPVRELGLSATVHGVRYPDAALEDLAEAGIDFRGWLPNHRVPEVFARHRVTVHVPRRPYVEALPGIPTIRPFEALACGIPLVSGPWRDTEGLFRPGTDFLVARDGGEMKDHLKALMDDPARRSGLAARGRERILDRHTCGHRVDQLLDIHRELAGEPAPARPQVHPHRHRPHGEDRMSTDSPRLDIAFFGSSLVSAYWNGAATYYRGLLSALARRGHRITFYEPDAFDRQKHRDIADPDWARVVVYPTEGTEGVERALEEAGGADLVVKASGVGVFDELLEREVPGLSGDGTVAAFWDVDAPATLERLAADPDDPFHDHLGRYELVLTYGGGPPVVEGYLAAGARRCEPVYNALDPDTHFPVEPLDRFQADLSFLGNRLPDREERVDEFFVKPARRLPGRSFLLGGSGWADRRLPSNVTRVGHVFTRHHNAFNCSPRAVLNVNRASMARFGYSPATRIFEAAGAGACIITDAWEGVEGFLEPGREILVARDGDGVVEHLEGLTPERAARIGDAARRRVLAKHTYDQRALRVERVLEGRGPAEGVAA